MIMLVLQFLVCVPKSHTWNYSAIFQGQWVHSLRLMGTPGGELLKLGFWIHVSNLHISDDVTTCCALYWRSVLCLCTVQCASSRGPWELLTSLLALCEGNPPVTGGFPSQRASNAEQCVYSCICIYPVLMCGLILAIAGKVKKQKSISHIFLTNNNNIQTLCRSPQKSCVLMLSHYYYSLM